MYLKDKRAPETPMKATGPSDRFPASAEKPAQSIRNASSSPAPPAPVYPTSGQKMEIMAAPRINTKVVLFTLKLFTLGCSFQDNLPAESSIKPSRKP